MKIKYFLFISFFLAGNFIFAQLPGTGLNFDDNNYGKVLKKATLTRSLYGNALPSEASLKKWAPYPKSQGSYGTCVGWSSTYAALSIVQAQKRNITDRSIITERAYSPWFVYANIRLQGDENCSMGTYVHEAMALLAEKGAPQLSEYNTECSQTIPAYVYNLAKNNTIADYAKLFDTYDNNATKIQAVKKSLSQNKPVVIGMKCPDSFGTAKGVWEPTEDPNANFGGHAMCIIGYSDQMYGGAFEIQNSWGDWWGNEGYIWIRYNDLASFTKYAFELIDNITLPDKENELAGSLDLVLKSGEAMSAELQNGTYTNSAEYKSGTRFRIYLSNSQPAFVYAIGFDGTGDVFTLFPHLPGVSPALTYSQNSVALPDEDHFIEMDATPGTDYLCVLYSATQLNIEEIKAKIATGGGSFEQRLQNAVGADLAPVSEVQYQSSGKMGFSYKGKKSVVACILATKHVD